MVKTHIHKSSHWTPPSVSRKSSSFKPPTVGIQPATGRWQRNEETAGWRAPLPSKVGKSYLSNSIQAKCDACEGKEKEETPEVQTKLTVGEPGDKYEQEADATAAKVVKQINSPGFNESVQTKVEPVAKPTVMRHGGISVGGIDPGVEQNIEGARGSGQGLSAEIKEPMEKAFGADFSGVKVHTDGNANQLNRSLHSRAFATGQDIFFKQGEYNPDNESGQELIAHELTHVVQQGLGHNFALSRLQLQRDRLADREEDVQFTQTETYQAFEAEVRQWVARRVLSRTDDAHRERTLVPSGSLRGFYSTIRPGQPITMHAHFHSNGYSFRQLTFSLHGEEVVIRLDQNEPETETEPSPETTQEPEQAPQDVVDPSREIEREGQQQVEEAVRDAVEGELLTAIGLGALSEILGIIGWIKALVDIWTAILTLPTARERDEARGFGAAVFANRTAHYVFTHSDREIMTAARRYISACQDSSDAYYRRVGQFMDDVLTNAESRWSTLRGRLDREREHPTSGEESRQFSSESELANYIVQHSPDVVSVEFWMGEYHQAWQLHHSFYRRR